MKKRAASVTDKEELAKIVKEVKEINKRFQQVKLEKEDTKEFMKEFIHMASIDTFDKFKDFIKVDGDDGCLKLVHKDYLNMNIDCLFKNISVV